MDFNIEQTDSIKNILTDMIEGYKQITYKYVVRENKEQAIKELINNTLKQIQKNL